MDIPLDTWKTQLEQELGQNILPFWVRHTPDLSGGGFHGAITSDLQILEDAPRSSVVNSRILWTFSAVYRVSQLPEHLHMATRAYAYLKDAFWDDQHGGVYWLVDHNGKVLETRKHSYAQGFAIYGLAEYYRVTGDTQALDRAKMLFDLLEQHAHLQTGGYLESLTSDWSAMPDMRLSSKEPHASQSMNTLLHLLEPFTVLLEVWPDPLLERRLRELVKLFLGPIFDAQTHHYKLYFDAQLNSLEPTLSYGHDIEAAWLLVRAAEILKDSELLECCRHQAVQVATAVKLRGLDTDGSVFYEGLLEGANQLDKHWWGQAEGMVGFFDAYQISGDPQFARAAYRCWNFIENHLIDHQHGDWFKITDQVGNPYPHLKVGPWECPYHHARACLEMLDRLERTLIIEQARVSAIS